MSLILAICNWYDNNFVNMIISFNKEIRILLMESIK